MPADEASHPARVAGHYARGDLITAIRDGLAAMGKTPDTVTVDDLSPVDEFHAGGRAATIDVMEKLAPSPSDHLLDVGCGLGGPARFVAARYGCRVTGIDLTQDYVEAGNVLCRWVGLADRVLLRQANALAIPFADETFTAGYMLHVGMNIVDKSALFAEVARLLKRGARFAVYEIMRMGEGDLNYPLPWTSMPETNAVAPLDAYQAALEAAGFEILSERNRKEFALAYFADQRAKASGAGGSPPLGLHTLMGEKRTAQVRNMTEGITSGRIAPVELIARKR